MDRRLQGQGSPVLRGKESSNNDTQQTYHNKIGQRRHAIISPITIFLAIVLIANYSNNGSSHLQYNSSERTNTILFDNSSDNNTSPLEKISSNYNTTISNKWYQ